MGTSGLVPCFTPYASENGKTVYGGIALEVLQNMAAQMPEYGPNYYNPAVFVAIDPEILKGVYDDLVVDSGADVLFHARICGVDADGSGRVQAALIAANDGLTAYRARIFIDCTGDGLTALWAGAECEKGSDEGDLMPATHCFTVGNVQEHAYYHDQNIGWLHGSMHPGNAKSFIHKVVEEGKHPLIEDDFLGDNPIGPNLVGFSAGHMWGVDSTNPMSVSRAMLRGRRIAREIWNVTRENFPEAFGGSLLNATANMVVHREGYRVMGYYVLTIEDYVRHADFPDEIGRSGFEIDVHPPKDPERARRLRELIGGNSIPHGTMGIPYRCLAVRGLTNVLVAGRSISCERLVLGSIRMMPVCMVTGQAAGTAAAIAVRSGSDDVHTVDTDLLRSRLRENGAYFHCARFSWRPRRFENNRFSCRPNEREAAFVKEKNGMLTRLGNVLSYR
jgi:hypothetical protein